MDDICTCGSWWLTDNECLSEIVKNTDSSEMGEKYEEVIAISTQQFKKIEKLRWNYYSRGDGVSRFGIYRWK